jgi:hypothetical protein
MVIPYLPVIVAELEQRKNNFLHHTEREDGQFIHRDCGGGIRRASVRVLLVENGKTITPTAGTETPATLELPYCETCDPPSEPEGFTTSLRLRLS